MSLLSLPLSPSFSPLSGLHLGSLSQRVDKVSLCSVSSLAGSLCFILFGHCVALLLELLLFPHHTGRLPAPIVLSLILRLALVNVVDR